MRQKLSKPRYIYTVILLGLLIIISLAFAIGALFDGFAAPQAQFEASTTSGPAPLTVNFTNVTETSLLNMLNADEFLWDFGEGVTMTTITIDDPVSHEYTKAGSYTVTLTAIKKGESLETSSTTLAIRVNHGSLAKVVLGPATVELDVNQRHGFNVKAFDAYDNPISGAQLAWEVAKGTGTIDGDGILIAGTRADTFDDGVTVTARLGTSSAEATASVTVNHGSLAKVVLDPTTVELDVNQRQEFNVKAFDAYDNPISGAQFTWEISKGTGAINGNGILTAGTQADTFDDGVTVTARLDTYSAEATASVTVKPDPLEIVTISPIDIAAGGTRQLEATMTDRHGNRLSDVDVSWSVTDENAGSVTRTGLFTAGKASGSFANAVEVEGIQGEKVRTIIVSASITPGPLEQVVIAPNPAVIGMGMSQQFVAVATDRYGNRLSDLAFTWSVGNGGGANDDTGLFIAGTIPGTYADSVKAETTQGTITRSDTASVTIEPDRIVFISDRNDDQYDIYIMEADGGNQQRLTTTIEDEGYPSFSTDGRRIAYGAEGGILTINDNGAWPMVLLSGRAGYVPAWSPDGTKIAFTSWEEDLGEIYVMDADGANITRLTDNLAYDGHPAWSPDGAEIAFTSYRDGNGEIYIMNADGTNVRRLSNHSTIDTFPSWSPDGAAILFQSDRDYRGIYIMNADGTNVRRLTSINYSSHHPSWSPDGTQIVFHSYRDGDDAEIYIMDRDGSSITRLTKNPGNDWAPEWASRKMGIEVTEASVIIPYPNTLKVMTTQEVTAQARGAVVSIETDMGSGSGFIIDPDGLVMTNNHVITDAAEITVYLDDGTSNSGTIVARDLVRDLALVRIKATGLPYLKLADMSQVSLGQQGVVLGYPLRAESVAVTSGLISSIDFDSGRNIIWVQTDSAINPGNSGGPILNLQGEVIGVVSAKTGGIAVEGVGFAISAGTVNVYLPRLEAGEVIRAF